MCCHCMLLSLVHSSSVHEHTALETSAKKRQIQKRQIIKSMIAEINQMTSVTSACSSSLRRPAVSSDTHITTRHYQRASLFSFTLSMLSLPTHVCTEVELALWSLCVRVCLSSRQLMNAYDTIWYDRVYLTCSKKLTCSQLSLSHGTNRKIKAKRTKNKSRSMISPVRSRDHEGSPG